MSSVIDDNPNFADDMTELLRAQADDVLIDGHEVFKIKLTKTN